MPLGGCDDANRGNQYQHRYNDTYNDSFAPFLLSVTVTVHIFLLPRVWAASRSMVDTRVTSD